MADIQTSSLGVEIRERRTALGLTVRALAKAADVSPAYISAIETGRGSVNGRNPAPSAAIITRLARALDVAPATLLAVLDDRETIPGAYILFFVTTPNLPMLSAIDELFGRDVDHWVCIADPRVAESDLSGKATTVIWKFGDAPYQTPFYAGESIAKALGNVIGGLPKRIRAKRVGLVIADNSAAMRYVQNPSDTVANERHWHDDVHAIWAEHMQAPPVIDICAYRAGDLRALGLTIDQLATTLTLITAHDRVAVWDGDGSALVDAAAIRRILNGVCPPGIADVTWHQITRAAAVGLTA